jgi:hypothetical protein
MASEPAVQHKEALHSLKEHGSKGLRSIICVIESQNGHEREVAVLSRLPSYRGCDHPSNTDNCPGILRWDCMLYGHDYVDSDKARFIYL